ADPRCDPVRPPRRVALPPIARPMPVMMIERRPRLVELVVAAAGEFQAAGAAELQAAPAAATVRGMETTAAAGGMESGRSGRRQRERAERSSGRNGQHEGLTGHFSPPEGSGLGSGPMFHPPVSRRPPEPGSPRKLKDLFPP